MARRKKTKKRSDKFYTAEYLEAKQMDFNAWDHRNDVVRARMLFALQKRRGWTPSHLAWVAHLSPGTVYNLVAGKTRNPTSRTLYWLSVALGVKLTWLMGLEGRGDRLAGAR